MDEWDTISENSVHCAACDESVPVGHTVLRSGLGRICWFCHTDEPVDGDEDEWDDEFEDWDDWDD